MRYSFGKIQNLLHFTYRKTHKKPARFLLSVLYVKYNTFCWNVSLSAKNLLFLEECSSQSSGKTKILMHVRKNSRVGKKICWGPLLHALLTRATTKNIVRALT